MNEKEESQNKNTDKLLNSFFYSTTTVVAGGIFFLISMFVIGWYVISMKDRESEIKIAEAKINDLQGLIQDVKIKQDQLNKKPIKGITLLQSPKGFTTHRIINLKNHIEVIKENPYFKQPYTKLKKIEHIQKPNIKLN